VAGLTKVALKAVKHKFGSVKKLKTPRLIPIPKTGGFLPAILPILSMLGVLGTVGSTVSTVVRNIKAAKEAKSLLEETKRHNSKLENTLKVGSGLYLKKYKEGGYAFITKKNFKKK
jgi:Trk-type K+ transport system membrane component